MNGVHKKMVTRMNNNIYTILAKKQVYAHFIALTRVDYQRYFIKILRISYKRYFI